VFRSFVTLIAAF